MVGKRVQFDEETWQAIQAVTRQTGKSFQELARTAFADMLKRHNQPVGFKAAFALFCVLRRAFCVPKCGLAET